jgi:hypothetical protein
LTLSTRIRNGAGMTRIHLPGLALYRCAICDEPTDQRHHASYREDELWSLVALCDRHHAGLHRCWEAFRREIPLALFTLQFVVCPEVVAQRAMRALPPAQLSFGDQLGREGETWRAWEASCVFIEREWERDDRSAA